MRTYELERLRSWDLPRIAHDPRVFEVFYREHVEAVQRFVARRVADPHQAADLTAEVFLAAIDSAPGYDPERGAVVAWLFGVARHVVNGWYRRAAREQRAVARIVGRELLEADDVTRIQERIDAAAQARAMYEALAALPEGERAVFELVALDELDPREAAAVLGIRPVTARVRLHRARTTLRTHLFDDSLDIARSMEAAS